MSNTEKNSNNFMEQRRQLLRLGAAGMPMVLTLRAGASGPLISQLQCVVTIPGSLRILVDGSGSAWVGNGNLKQKKGKYKSKDINNFKSNADYTFPNNSAPSQFRPSGCSTGDDDDDDNSCYELYSLDAYQLITPGDYVDINGNWNLNSDSASLYIALSARHADLSPSDGSWPGISCIVSILNYLGQN